MAISAQKLTDLEYNEILTLRVIEGEEDLKGLLSKRTPLSFSLLYSIAKQNKLNPETKELLEVIFNDIILTKEELISKYKRYASGESIDVTPEVKVEPIAEPVKKEVKRKKAKELPRRYGKEAILRDVEAQGGKATPLQNAMLRVNDLKNIYVNLSARGIKDMLGGTNLLSDADCRDITSAITIVERKLEEILKRK